MVLRISMARTIFPCGGIQSKGTGRSIVVTDEYWHAEDIRLNLLEKHNDPRKGDQFMAHIRTGW
jgi:hypothetical protein